MTTQTTTESIAHGTGSYCALIVFGELTDETMPAVALNGARLLEVGGSHLIALFTEDGTLKYSLHLDGKLNFNILHGSTAQMEGIEAGTGRKVTVQLSSRLGDEEFAKIRFVSSRELQDLAESPAS